jgi:histidinol phosphatase-like PHP family hydrolase/predicted phosphodiesterase
MNAEPALNILVLSDLHYVDRAQGAGQQPRRDAWLGPLLLRKALLRLKHLGIEVGLVVLLGDMVDDGWADGAEEDLAALSAAAQAAGLPVLAVPGNHDGSAEYFSLLFGCPPGLHEIGGYGFLLFHDHVGEGHVTTRPAEELALPARVARERPDLPLVALQHNPLHPPIDDEYPFLLTNAAAVLQGYAAAGVCLSLSGHYHAGQALHDVDGVSCYTLPAACEAPYRFALLRLRGRRVAVEEYALRMSTPGLVDVHCHTEYAYCATTVQAAQNVAVARAMGLRGLCLTEHAFQLYFEPHEAWSYRWQRDADRVRRAWDAGRGRMPAYRQFTRSMREDDVRLGLEVELYGDGQLLLAPQDREGWDLLVGAVHQIAGLDGTQASQAEAAKLFMRDTERLLAHPIDVLAHPFRWFRRAGFERPAHLYREVAGMLARRGVAAEVNWHVNDPDPRFVSECLARGVRIALASDAHDLAEVAEFVPHLDVLRQAGVRDEELDTVLFRPW